MIAVVDGLEAGETVATSGLLKLGSGVPVRIDNSITPTTEQQPTPDNG
jgi:membrane fusion protein (multidrug efflux system)